jgi:hypothetical protein
MNPQPVAAAVAPYFKQAKAEHLKKWLTEIDGAWAPSRREHWRAVGGQPRQVDGKAPVWLAFCQGCNWHSGKAPETKVRQAIRQHNLAEALKLVYDAITRFWEAAPPEEPEPGDLP